VSVINQMLKDLDKRAPEQGQAPTTIVENQKSSTFKIVLISVVVLLCLNALGFYIWNLQEQVAKSRIENVIQTAPSQSNEVKKQKISTTESVEQPLANQASQPTQQVATSIESVGSVLASSSNKVIPSEIKSVDHAALAATSQPSTEMPTEPPEAEKAVTETLSHQPSKVIKPEVAKSKMSVSRRQLTSKELIEQKLIKAEKLISLNELTKAEQLFEDVLIIKPEHKEARKKLAALWFGKKAYQQAVNLLSQGIAIDRQDGELRLLKARVLLKQGQHKAAYHTLKPLDSLENEEYQVMLANIAQQTEQFSSAIIAYQVLIKMQPYSGRWHLGLAITYDKNGQFLLAINEYALALTKANLSASSAEFAEQRMQALGE